MFVASIGMANDLSPRTLCVMSLFVFARSAQSIAATLAGTDMSVWIIILTVWIINLRYVLYATHLMPHFSTLPQRIRGPLAFILTDEAFATTASRLNTQAPGPIAWYYVGAGLVAGLMATAGHNLLSIIAVGVLVYGLARWLP